MNLRNPLFVLAAILLPSSASAASLNLFQVQKISNFPTACTAAYSFDIPDCTRSEITVTGQITSDGQGICSSQCISALDIVDRNLNRACSGIQASPNTLIGLFFAGRGISYLCPNSVEGNGPAPSSTAREEDSAAATSPVPPSSASTVAQTAPSSPPTSPTQTPESSATPPAPSPPTTAAPPSPSFETTTAADNGVATVLTSDAQRSDSPNPDAFGGGGSPFEVVANAASGWGRTGCFRNVVPPLTFAASFWAVVVACWIMAGE